LIPPKGGSKKITINTTDNSSKSENDMIYHVVSKIEKIEMRIYNNENSMK
jgi:hypothetical protein